MATSMNLKTVKNLGRRGILREGPCLKQWNYGKVSGNQAEILRAQAYVFCLIGDYRSAIQDREAILALQEGELEDFICWRPMQYLLAILRRQSSIFRRSLLWAKSKNEACRVGLLFLLPMLNVKLGEYDSCAGKHRPCGCG